MALKMETNELAYLFLRPLRQDKTTKNHQQILWHGLQNRVRPRFFDQVGHETTYASSGNKHFFTKSCHRRTYQNYEQRRQKLGTILEKKVS